MNHTSLLAGTPWYHANDFLHFHRTHFLGCNHRNLILNTVHFGRSAFITSNIQVFLALVNARSLCFLPTNNFEVWVANLATTHNKIIRFLVRTSIEFVMSKTGCWWHQCPLCGSELNNFHFDWECELCSSTETDITWEVEIPCRYELFSKRFIVEPKIQSPVVYIKPLHPISSHLPFRFFVACKNISTMWASIIFGGVRDLRWQPLWAEFCCPIH